VTPNDRALGAQTQDEEVPDHTKEALKTGKLALLSQIVQLLLVSGQTTERLVHATERVGAKLGMRVAVLPGWGATILAFDNNQDHRQELVPGAPIAVDMRKVSMTMSVVDEICDGRRDIASADAALGAVSRLPPISVLRFATLAAAGAAALAILFGSRLWPEILLVAATAGVGALVRRGLALVTKNLFVQPFTAALVAGLAGAFALRHAPGSMSSLVALCSCMILVPGPHLLNGALDLVRGRLPLGGARIGYASMTILMICTGLLFGLAIGGANLPVNTPPASVSLLIDVISAGVAVMAYGTFFSMPWRMLPIPVAIGMAAHAVRWVMIGVAHASPALGALGACALVGVLMTPIANWLHLPFAGCAFAAVVSLIPGIYLLRMAGALVQLVAVGGAGSPDLVSTAIGDGTAAMIILVAMAAGLIVPKLLIEGYRPQL
jgi:uncharacterized membrane protein YjjP (DUF1212 family)